MKLKVFTLLSMLIISLQSHAYQDEIDKFFALYESGKSDEAVDSIYSSNKWATAKTDDIHNVKTQLQNVNRLMGAYQGKVKLGDDDIENRLAHVSYLVLFERQPIRMEFTFYRPKDAWIIYSYSFDDEIDEDLAEFSRKKIAGWMTED